MVAEVRPVVGAIAANVGAVVVALPSVVAENDILVWHSETEDVAVTPPAGWAHVLGSPVSQPTAPATRKHVWWKRAGASETNPTFPDSGDHQISYIYAIKGCPTTGDPWDVTATAVDNATDTSGECPSVTTTVINTCITCMITTGFDRATNTSSWHSGWSNTSLQSSSAMTPVNALTERRDNTNNTGSGGTLGMATGFKPAAGVVNATTVNVLDATTKALMTVAWKSANPAIDVLIGESSTADASPYTTMTVAAQANSLLVLGLLVSGTAVATPTISGLGLTWSLVDTQTVGTTADKLAVYSAQVGASEVSGQITISVSTTPTGCSWVLYKVNSHNQTTPIVQAPKTSIFAASLTLNWAAAADSLNRQIVFVGVSPQNTGNTITPEAGWVEGAEVVRSTPNKKLWAAHQPTAFDSSITVTDDSSYDYGAIGLEINFVSGPAATSYSNASETDSAQAIAERKTKALSVAAETNTATSISERKTKALAQAAETSTALTWLKAKQKSMQQCAETDDTQTVARRKVKSYGAAVETDTGTALTLYRSRTLGIAADTNSALAWARSKTWSLLQASDASDAQQVTAQKLKPVLTAFTVDQALPTAYHRARALGEATEASTALPVAKHKQRAILVAVETDAARAISLPGVMRVTMGVATEADIAMLLAGRSVKAITAASDTSEAMRIIRLRTIVLGAATDTAQALPVVFKRVYVLSPASDFNEALQLDRAKHRVIAVAAELDTALSIVMPSGLVIEGDVRVVINSGKTTVYVVERSTSLIVSANNNVTLSANGATGIDIDEHKTTAA